MCYLIIHFKHILFNKSKINYYEYKIRFNNVILHSFHELTQTHKFDNPFIPLHTHNYNYNYLLNNKRIINIIIIILTKS